MKSIGEIKAELQAACEDELPDFITCYKADERAGVQKLVESAGKRIQALEKEKARIEALRVYEEEYLEFDFICGIDEVGRGPLAGPVVAGAVILPRDCRILYINDSKQLSEKKREELYSVIQKEAVSCAVGYASPERIDEINILQATYEAMREAIGKLSVKPDILLNDAVRIPGVDIRQVPIIKGDARDHLMEEYDRVFPEYDFAGNKGYGSAAHIEALKKFGPTPIHRRSFIKNFGNWA